MLIHRRCGARWLGAVAALALCCAAPAVFVRAARAQAPASRSGEQLPSIKVDVDVVNVFVTVKDKKGKIVDDLAKNDFEVFEDGQKQQIRYFARQSDLPLTLGLLVDTSVSQGALVPAEREAAEVFFRRVLGKKDLAFLFGFDTDVDLLQDYTNNVPLLTRGLERLRVNSAGPPVNLPSAQGPFPSIQHGGTLLYDAVYLAASEQLASQVGRKAIVLITDGEDQGSRMKIDQAIEAAQRADAIIYGILFYDRSFYGLGMGYSGDSALRKMAEETGGRVVRVDRRRNLGQAFEEIADELRSQYSIGYTPANTRAKGGFRRLRIKTIRDNMKVQARKGYYANGPASAGN